MQDGFDKSVAGKMPKSLKCKPNRPWNVDPVLLHKPSVDQERLVLPKDKEEAGKDASVQEGHVKIHGALDTIEDLSAEFTDALFQKKDAQRHLRETQAALENTVNENSSLKTTLVELEKRITNEERLRQEISFLNEQAEDANLYMENISMMLTEKTKETEDISVEKKGVENKLYRLNEDIHSKATLDVKVSILEKELGLAHNRVKEMETLLHAQQEETVSLGKESKELKGALDKVYASLAHIRLKAKKEAYGL
ncbi:MAG: hypothetical protein U9P49_00855 [Thermodesulfobacteriota bacterium]|nr:hypothetical protein [Thermodesulfobacteriota bacterium]